MLDYEKASLLTSLTHFDGRNGVKLFPLRPYFSEIAWMKKRLEIMIAYTKAVYEELGKKKLTGRQQSFLESLNNNFSLTDAEEIQQREALTNHDLKAIEDFFVGKIRRQHLDSLIPYVNLGIGSEDINSIALALQLRESRDEVLVPALKSIAGALISLAEKEKETLMVARTHAQAANLTTFGKEIANTLVRLCDEYEIFSTLTFQAKCSGEAGTFAAQSVVGRKIDWLDFTDSFIRTFGLVPAHGATQIAPYDSAIRYLSSLARINSILCDFVKNIWLYVLLGYVKITKVSAEVGSAGMPHKVNPIYFEGAEGGFEMADGIIETLVRKLPFNRLQRDFSDSTVRRNMVLPISLSLLSYQSVSEGLKRLSVDDKAIAESLVRHQEVWIETVKTFAKLHGVENAYEILKVKTRGKTLTPEELNDVVTSLPLSVSEKEELSAYISGGPNSYPGRIVEESVIRAKKLIEK